MASAPDPLGQDNTYPHFLGKRYNSISKIGQGGMGAVYKAFDNDLLKDVVIKVIVSEDDYEKHAIEFQKEAKALSRLKNDNLVTLYDFGIGEGETLYMVLEYVEGNTLSQLLNETIKLSPRKALPIFLQICNGLIHAHSNQVIHRDLKPENVIVGKDVDEQMLAKVIDFGIARVEDGQSTSTELNTIKGSPFYLAPEVIKGKKATEKSDIYSLGCLMFKTLTGKLPFQGKTVFETYDKHTREPIPIVEDSIDNCPKELSLLIKNCMNKDPADRPASLAQVKKELEIIYHGRTETIIPTDIDLSIDENTHISEQKSLKALFIAISVILIGISGLTIFSLFSDPAPTKNEMTEQKEEEKPETRKPPYVVHDPFKSEVIYDDKAWEARFVELSDDQIAEILLKKEPRGITLMHSSANGTFFNRLIEWPIKSINLEMSDITDEGLEAISKIKTIEVLQLTATKITNSGLVYLYTLPKLRHLELSMCPYINEDGVIGVLKNCRALDSIKLNQLVLSDKVIPLLVSKHFSTIEVAATGLSDKSIQSLANIPNLNCIDISGNPQVTNETFLKFAKLPNLGKLEFTRSQKIKDSDIDKYSKIFKSAKKTFNCRGR